MGEAAKKRVDPRGTIRVFKHILPSYGDAYVLREHNHAFASNCIPGQCPSGTSYGPGCLCGARMHPEGEKCPELVRLPDEGEDR